MNGSFTMRVAGACVLLLAAACDSKPEPEVAAKAKPAVEPKADAAEADKKKPGKPAMPPEARRNTLPEGVDASALTVGQPAPALKDLPSTQGAWSQGSAPATIVVFYRGFW